MPRRKRKQKGEGPAWDWIKKTAGKLHNFVRDNRLVSRGAATLAPLAGPYSGTINRIGNVAGSLGYGKRKRKRRPGRPKKK